MISFELIISRALSTNRASSLILSMLASIVLPSTTLLTSTQQTSGQSIMSLSCAGGAGLLTAAAGPGGLWDRGRGSLLVDLFDQPFHFDGQGLLLGLQHQTLAAGCGKSLLEVQAAHALAKHPDLVVAALQD